ncbi:MAG: DinB family protein [Segetibacter sp.]
MVKESLHSQKLMTGVNDVYSQLLRLVSSFPEEEFNASPATNSWSAAQVCEHVIKSNKAIAQAMNSEGKTTEREPDQRVLELKELFLNFTAKFQSPESVLPCCAAYKQQTFIEDMQASTDDLEELITSIK